MTSDPKHELGRMAPHFAAMNEGQRWTLQHRLLCLAAVLSALTLAHVALSAPGKIGRTLNLHHQIEGDRE